MAANKISAMTQLSDITECCICLKTFTDPRMLPCIHTYCFQCLETLTGKLNKKPGESLPCPVCRKEFTIPSDGVQGIQNNFFMAGMIEVRNALNQSNMASLPCDICKANSDDSTGKIPEATNRCIVCQENLCESCCKMHKSFKVSKNHEIMEIGNDIPAEVIVRNMQTISCDVHRGKVLEYYCAECKKVVCVSCLFESHRTHDCKDVTTLEGEFRQLIKGNADMISTFIEELMAKKEKSKSKDDFLKEIDAREKEILQRNGVLKRIIDEHTDTLLSSLSEIKNRHLKEIQTEEDELERRLTILESFAKYCDELRVRGSASDVCRSKDELLRRADELEDDHETFIMLPRVSFDVTFQATDLDKMIRTTNGNIIGSMKASVEQLEDFAVAIVGNESLVEMNFDLFMIKLRGESEIDPPFQTIPTETSYFAAAVHGKELFLTGVGKQYSEIWKYSFASGWNKCGSLAQGRQFHGAEFIGETLYICGGILENIVLDSIEAYNALTEKTAEIGQLIVGCGMPAPVTYKDLLYVFGGADRTNDQPFLDCVQVFNPVDNTCTLLSTSMPRPAAWLRAVLWKTFAIIQAQDECFVFDFEEKTWQTRQQFKPDTGLFLFGVVLENERIYIIGGAIDEVDAQGKKKAKFKDNVKYVRASSIVNNEAAKWKICDQLPKPIAIVATAKLSLSN